MFISSTYYYREIQKKNISNSKNEITNTTDFFNFLRNFNWGITKRRKLNQA
ncbi:hypothetical protein [Seonamhaeicola sp.]|uniref:hypothetical protein n=1 Tax=Seonamhaeicola sp. TaxID=1912245 RepID=UPI0035627829